MEKDAEEVEAATHKLREDGQWASSGAIIVQLGASCNCKK
jgi:hypothetical protein